MSIGYSKKLPFPECLHGNARRKFSAGSDRNFCKKRCLKTDRKLNGWFAVSDPAQAYGRWRNNLLNHSMIETYSVPQVQADIVFRQAKVCTGSQSAIPQHTPCLQCFLQFNRPSKIFCVNFPRFRVCSLLKELVRERSWLA